MTFDKLTHSCSHWEQEALQIFPIIPDNALPRSASDHEPFSAAINPNKRLNETTQFITRVQHTYCKYKEAVATQAPGLWLETVLLQRPRSILQLWPGY
jgi:hypothetical protein